MAAAAGGPASNIVAFDPDGLPIYRERSFTEEIRLLETIGGAEPMINKRFNNNITVTGFRTLSTSTISPICTRHGMDFAAELDPDSPHIVIKFKPVSELAGDESGSREATAAAKKSDAINIDTADAFKACVEQWLECGTTSAETHNDFVTFLFDVRVVTKAQCDILDELSAVSAINILPTGLQVVFCIYTDSKSSLRFLKRYHAHLFTPHTADPAWMHRACALTATSKRSTAARKRATAKPARPTSFFDTAAKFIGLG